MSVERTRSLRGLLTKERVEMAFKKVKSNHDVAVDGCHYELIREDRYKDMMNFYGEQFCLDEPMNRSLNLSWDQEVVTTFAGSLQQNLSIALVSTQSGEIVGGRILIIARKNKNVDTSKYKSEPFKKIMDLTYNLSTLCDMFEHYKVEEMVHFFGLVVHRDYRQKGIGTKLQKAAIAFVKNLGLGPVVIRGEGSSNYSQRIYEKLGFECLAVIAFADYKVNGEVVVKNTAEHKNYKLYGKVV